MKIEVEEGCKEISVVDVESLPDMYKYCRLCPLPNIDNDIQFYIWISQLYFELPSGLRHDFLSLKKCILDFFLFFYKISFLPFARILWRI